MCFDSTVNFSRAQYSDEGKMNNADVWALTQNYTILKFVSSGSVDTFESITDFPKF